MSVSQSTPLSPRATCIPFRAGRSQPKERGARGDWREEASGGDSRSGAPPAPFACRGMTPRGPRGPTSHTTSRQVFRLQARRVRLPGLADPSWAGQPSGWSPNISATVNPRQHLIRRRVRGGFSPRFPFQPRGGHAAEAPMATAEYRRALCGVKTMSLIARVATAIAPATSGRPGGCPRPCFAPRRPAGRPRPAPAARLWREGS